MNPPRLAARFLAADRIGAALTELGVVGAVVLELAWFTPWFRYFNPAARAMGELRVLGILLAAAILAMLAERTLSTRDTRRFVRSSGLVLLLLAQTAMLLLVFHPSYPGLSTNAFVSRAFAAFGEVLEVIPAELVIILGTMFVFRRGILAASRDVLAPEAVHFRFRLGIVILAAFGLIFRDGDGHLLLEALPAYFFAGLLALAVSRINRASAVAGGALKPIRVAWIVALLFVIFSTVVLAQSVSSLLQSRVVGEGLKILGTAALEALRILVFLLSPLIQVVGVILAWLMRTITTILGGTDGVSGFLGGIQTQRLNIPPGPSGTPSWIQAHAQAIASVATGLTLALLALAAIRGGRKGSRRGELQKVEEAEGMPWSTVDSDGERGLVDVAGRRGRVSLAALGQVFAADSIRRIYGRLLRLADSLGRGRSPTETPLEFLPVLRELFPYHQDEVGLITQAYLHVQYGGRPDDDAGLEKVKRAWASMQSSGGPGVEPRSIAG